MARPESESPAVVDPRQRTGNLKKCSREVEGYGLLCGTIEVSDLRQEYLGSVLSLGMLLEHLEKPGLALSRSPMLGIGMLLPLLSPIREAQRGSICFKALSIRERLNYCTKAVSPVGAAGPSVAVAPPTSYAPMSTAKPWGRKLPTISTVGIQLRLQSHRRYFPRRSSCSRPSSDSRR